MRNSGISTRRRDWLHLLISCRIEGIMFIRAWPYLCHLIGFHMFGTCTLSSLMILSFVVMYAVSLNFLLFQSPPLWIFWFWSHSVLWVFCSYVTCKAQSWRHICECCISLFWLPITSGLSCGVVLSLLKCYVIFWLTLIMF